MHNTKLRKFNENLIVQLQSRADVIGRKISGKALPVQLFYMAYWALIEFEILFFFLPYYLFSLNTEVKVTKQINGIGKYVSHPGPHIGVTMVSVLVFLIQAGISVFIASTLVSYFFEFIIQRL